jgi:hypothetical protein
MRPAAAQQALVCSYKSANSTLDFKDITQARMPVHVSVCILRLCEDHEPEGELHVSQEKKKTKANGCQPTELQLNTIQHHRVHKLCFTRNRPHIFGR